MSTPSQPEPVKLITSCIACSQERIDAIVTALAETFGQPDFTSSCFAFDNTSYYGEELGGPLKRRIVAFKKLFRPERLSEAKQLTNRIEKTTEQEGRRTVNIDPGYLSRSHLILATGKGFAHRPYLRDGIYADVTLLYRHGTFERLEWTYPDYADEPILSFLSHIRKRYVLQLKAGTHQI